MFWTEQFKIIRCTYRFEKRYVDIVVLLEYIWVCP